MYMCVCVCVLLYTQNALQSWGGGGVSSQLPSVRSIHLDDAMTATVQRRQCAHRTPAYTWLLFIDEHKLRSKSSKLNHLSSYKTSMGCPKITLQKQHKVNMTVSHTTTVNESICLTWLSYSLCVVSEVVVSPCITQTKNLCLCSSEESHKHLGRHENLNFWVNYHF